MSTRKFTREVVLRRVEFLIQEAQSKNPHYDQSVQMIMRLISNYTTVGVNSGSKGVKKLNKNMSEKAWDLKSKLNSDDFHDATTNEHHFPLKDLWDWMIENKEGLSSDQVLDKFYQYPFVTVTREENSALNKLKKLKLSPEDRYNRCSIKIKSI